MERFSDKRVCPTRRSLVSLFFLATFMWLVGMATIVISIHPEQEDAVQIVNTANIFEEEKRREEVDHSDFLKPNYLKIDISHLRPIDRAYEFFPEVPTPPPDLS